MAESLSNGGSELLCTLFPGGGSCSKKSPDLSSVKVAGFHSSSKMQSVQKDLSASKCKALTFEINGK